MVPSDLAAVSLAGGMECDLGDHDLDVPRQHSSLDDASQVSQHNPREVA